MDSDTAVNAGALATISGLLCLIVKWMLDNESRKIDLVLAKLDEIDRRLDPRGNHEDSNLSDRPGTSSDDSS